MNKAALVEGDLLENPSGDMVERKRIGLLGGSFDPFHLGHLSIAKEAAKSLNLEKIYLVPAYKQPFKEGHSASWEQRVEMVKLVAKEYDFLEVLTIEGERKKDSYTYDTVMEIKEAADCEVILIMGSDSLLSIEKWYRAGCLLGACSLAVAKRPGVSDTEILEECHRINEKYGTSVRLLENNLIWISSTNIKLEIERGGSIKNLVPKCVEQYIMTRGLYV